MLIEISYRDVPKTDELDDLIRAKADRLQKFCEGIMSCRIAVERLQQRQKLGTPHRVRIEVTLPPNKDLVVSRDPGESVRERQGRKLPYGRPWDRNSRSHR